MAKRAVTAVVSPLSAFWWRGLLDALTSKNTDTTPRDLAVATYNVHQRTGLGLRAFAQRLGTNHTTISELEHRRRSSTPGVLVTLAKFADELGMVKHAEYFRLQAHIREMEIRNKGGRR